MITGYQNSRTAVSSSRHTAKGTLNAELIWRAVNRDHAFTALVEAAYAALEVIPFGDKLPKAVRLLKAALILAQPVKEIRKHG